MKEKLENLNLIKDQEIQNIKEKYKILNEEKNQNIDGLILRLNNNLPKHKDYNESLDGDKLIAINFRSEDQHINHSIICRNKTKFNVLEEQLYEKYPEYVDGENIFMFNETTINKLKNLEDNGICGYTIMVKKNED